MLANVADVTAPDASTVVITMTQPDALVEYALAATAAHVVNKKFVEANGDKYGTPEVGSIGTGPFKFVEWQSGDHQKLARFDDYWDKTAGPYLDEITIKIIPEPTTRVAGLQTGRHRLHHQQHPVGPVRDGQGRSPTSTSPSPTPTTASGSRSTPRRRRSTTSRPARR